jgi:hypothetical protein
MQKIAGGRAVSIAISEICLEPGPFCMSFHFNTDFLKRSLERFGLWSPLFVVDMGKEGLQMVMGYRRIHALKSLRERLVACIDLTDCGLSTFDLLMLNFYDNLTTRSFNDVEKAMILARLSRYLPEDQITQTYMSLLQLPAHEETLHLYLGIEELDGPLKRSVATGAVSLKALERLMGLDHVSRKSLSLLFSKIKFNFNNQLKFIEYIIDLSIKEGAKISDLLMHGPIQDILQDHRTNPPQKVKKLLTHMRSRRFPTLSRYEEVFRQEILKLSLPDDVTLYHAPYFETSDIRLEIAFREGKELKKRLAALLDLEGLEEIEKALRGKPR